MMEKLKREEKNPGKPYSDILSFSKAACGNMVKLLKYCYFLLLCMHLSLCTLLEQL